MDHKKRKDCQAQRLRNYESLHQHRSEPLRGGAASASGPRWREAGRYQRAAEPCSIFNANKVHPSSPAQLFKWIRLQETGAIRVLPHDNAGKKKKNNPEYAI